jgi:predicted short-subunit dehydrogenase-like oxidoreductase (DUF2520 family)
MPWSLPSPAPTAMTSIRSHPAPAPPEERRALAGLTFSLVGPGRAGASVARWLLAAGARLAAVAGRPSRPALPRWAAKAGARLEPVDTLRSAGQDLLLVAVRDAELPQVAAALAARPQAGVVLHLAGALPADVLAPLAAAGSHVGGLHPLRAFPRPLPALAVARRTFFALDGDAAAVALGQRLSAALGAPAAIVPPASRPLYHLAATLVAGGAVTLAAVAAELHSRVAVPRASRPGLLELGLGALRVAPPEHPATAVTGPLARGDEGYLAQLERLREVAPELHPLAVLLALETLRQLSTASPATPSQARIREHLLALCGAPGFLDPLLGGV